MKKLFALTALVAAGLVSSASAMDRTGQLALGFQETFSNTTLNPNNTGGTWSLKYGLSERWKAQFVFGFDFFNKSAGNRRMDLGARFLVDAVQNENSDFYTGIGFLYDMDGIDVFRVNIPLGYEFSFPGLSEVAFSAEAGLTFEYQTNAPKAFAVNSTGGNVGGNLGLGVHYYF